MLWGSLHDLRGHHTECANNNSIPVFNAFYYSGLKQLMNIPFRWWEYTKQCQDP